MLVRLVGDLPGCNVKDVCGFSEIKPSAQKDLFDVICRHGCVMCISKRGFCVSVGVCALCHHVLIKAYRHVSPLPTPIPSPFVDPLPLCCYLILFSVSLLCSTLLLIFTPPLHLVLYSYVLFIHSLHRPKVISTGRPSMKIQC